MENEIFQPKLKNGLSRAIKVVILCFVWYGASSASNIINKIVLNGTDLIKFINFFTREKNKKDLKNNFFSQKILKKTSPFP